MPKLPSRINQRASHQKSQPARHHRRPVRRFSLFAQSHHCLRVDLTSSGPNIISIQPHTQFQHDHITTVENSSNFTSLSHLSQSHHKSRVSSILAPFGEDLIQPYMSSSHNNSGLRHPDSSIPSSFQYLRRPLNSRLKSHLPSQSAPYGMTSPSSPSSHRPVRRMSSSNQTSSAHVSPTTTAHRRLSFSAQPSPLASTPSEILHDNVNDDVEDDEEEDGDQDISGKSPPESIKPDRNLPPKQRKKVIIITGGTAVGKTSLSLELARKLNGEIISADSMQVYSTFDTGTAKVGLDETNGIPHHLIDSVVAGGTDFSASMFFSAATEIINNVVSRHKVPIIVGGTGLYLRWLLYGRPQGMNVSPDQVMRTTCIQHFMNPLTAGVTSWEKSAGAGKGAGRTQVSTYNENRFLPQQRQQIESIEAIVTSRLEHAQQQKQAFASLYNTETIQPYQIYTDLLLEEMQRIVLCGNFRWAKISSTKAQAQAQSTTRQNIQLDTSDINGNEHIGNPTYVHVQGIRQDITMSDTQVLPFQNVPFMSCLEALHWSIQKQYDSLLTTSQHNNDNETNISQSSLEKLAQLSRCFFLQQQPFNIDVPLQSTDHHHYHSETSSSSSPQQEETSPMTMFCFQNNFPVPSTLEQQYNQVVIAQIVKLLYQQFITTTSMIYSQQLCDKIIHLFCPSHPAQNDTQQNDRHDFCPQMISSIDGHVTSIGKPTVLPIIRTEDGVEYTPRIVALQHEFATLLQSQNIKTPLVSPILNDPSLVANIDQTMTVISQFENLTPFAISRPVLIELLQEFNNLVSNELLIQYEQHKTRSQTQDQLRLQLLREMKNHNIDISNDFIPHQGCDSPTYIEQLSQHQQQQQSQRRQQQEYQQELISSQQQQQQSSSSSPPSTPIDDRTAVLTAIQQNFLSDTSSTMINAPFEQITLFSSFQFEQHLTEQYPPYIQLIRQEFQDPFRLLTQHGYYHGMNNDDTTNPPGVESFVHACFHGYSDAHDIPPMPNLPISSSIESPSLHSVGDDNDHQLHSITSHSNDKSNDQSAAIIEASSIFSHKMSTFHHQQDKLIHRIMTSLTSGQYKRLSPRQVGTLTNNPIFSLQIVVPGIEKEVPLGIKHRHFPTAPGLFQIAPSNMYIYVTFVTQDQLASSTTSLSTSGSSTSSNDILPITPPNFQHTTTPSSSIHPLSQFILQHRLLESSFSLAVSSWIDSYRCNNDLYRLEKSICHALATDGQTVPAKYKSQMTTQPLRYLSGRESELDLLDSYRDELPQTTSEFIDIVHSSMPSLTGKQPTYDEVLAKEQQFVNSPLLFNPIATYAEGLINRFDVRCYFLQTHKNLHYRLADFRCEQMIRGGMLKETLLLLNTYNTSRALLPDINDPRAVQLDTSINNKNAISITKQQQQHQSITDSATIRGLWPTSPNFDYFMRSDPEGYLQRYFPHPFHETPQLLIQDGGRKDIKQQVVQAESQQQQQQVPQTAVVKKGMTKKEKQKIEAAAAAAAAAAGTDRENDLNTASVPEAIVSSQQPQQPKSLPQNHDEDISHAAQISNLPQSALVSEWLRMDNNIFAFRSVSLPMVSHMYDFTHSLLSALQIVKSSSIEHTSMPTSIQSPSCPDAFSHASKILNSDSSQSSTNASLLVYNNQFKHMLFSAIQSRHSASDVFNNNALSTLTYNISERILAYLGAAMLHPTVYDTLQQSHDYQDDDLRAIAAQCNASLDAFYVLQPPKSTLSRHKIVVDIPSQTTIDSTIESALHQHNNTSIPSQVDPRTFIAAIAATGFLLERQMALAAPYKQTNAGIETDDQYTQDFVSPLFESIFGPSWRHNKVIQTCLQSIGIPLTYTIRSQLLEYDWSLSDGFSNNAKTNNDNNNTNIDLVDRTSTLHRFATGRSGSNFIDHVSILQNSQTSQPPASANVSISEQIAANSITTSQLLEQLQSKSSLEQSLAQQERERVNTRLQQSQTQHIVSQTPKSAYVLFPCRHLVTLPNMELIQQTLPDEPFYEKNHSDEKQPNTVNKPVNIDPLANTAISLFSPRVKSIGYTNILGFFTDAKITAIFTKWNEFMAKKEKERDQQYHAMLKQWYLEHRDDIELSPLLREQLIAHVEQNALHINTPESFEDELSSSTPPEHAVVEQDEAFEEILAVSTPNGAVPPKKPSLYSSLRIDQDGTTRSTAPSSNAADQEQSSSSPSELPLWKPRVFVSNHKDKVSQFLPTIGITAQITPHSSSTLKKQTQGRQGQSVPASKLPWNQDVSIQKELLDMKLPISTGFVDCLSNLQTRSGHVPPTKPPVVVTVKELRAITPSEFIETFMRLVSEFQTSTRGYIKRQYTFFQDEPVCQLVTIPFHNIPTLMHRTDADVYSRYLEICKEYLAKDIGSQYFSLLREQQINAIQRHIKPSQQHDGHVSEEQQHVDFSKIVSVNNSSHHLNDSFSSDDSSSNSSSSSSSSTLSSSLSSSSTRSLPISLPHSINFSLVPKRTWAIAEARFNQIALGSYNRDVIQSFISQNPQHFFSSDLHNNCTIDGIHYRLPPESLFSPNDLFRLPHDMMTSMKQAALTNTTRQYSPDIIDVLPIASSGSKESLQSSSRHPLRRALPVVYDFGATKFKVQPLQIQRLLLQQQQQRQKQNQSKMNNSPSSPHDKTSLSSHPPSTSSEETYMRSTLSLYKDNLQFVIDDIISDVVSKPQHIYWTDLLDRHENPVPNTSISSLHELEFSQQEEQEQIDQTSSDKPKTPFISDAVQSNSIQPLPESIDCKTDTNAYKSQLQLFWNDGIIEETLIDLCEFQRGLSKVKHHSTSPSSSLSPLSQHNVRNTLLQYCTQRKTVLDQDFMAIRPDISNLSPTNTSQQQFKQYLHFVHGTSCDQATNCDQVSTNSTGKTPTSSIMNPQTPNIAIHGQTMNTPHNMTLPTTATNINSVRKQGIESSSSSNETNQNQLVGQRLSYPWFNYDRLDNDDLFQFKHAF